MEHGWGNKPNMNNAWVVTLLTNYKGVKVVTIKETSWNNERVVGKIGRTKLDTQSNIFPEFEKSTFQTVTTQNILHLRQY